MVFENLFRFCLVLMIDIPDSPLLPPQSVASPVDFQFQTQKLIPRSIKKAKLRPRSPFEYVFVL